VLVYVYGEPAAQTVLDRWGGKRELFHRYLAGQGYIVLSIDNRGTPAPKGRDWRHIVDGAIGVLAPEEQAAALRTLAHQRSYLDLDRVAVWGWSGGGSMTLHLMFRHPELYKAGLVVAPMADQRYYDTIYQERYMGTPSGNPNGYKAGSPISYAEGLRGRLLIAQGSGDDNCHFQATELLVNRLIALNKPFDEQIYPNRTHAIEEGEGTTAHLYSTLARHLELYLPPGAR
jgi:dipeptidyl-peptidase-4